MASKDIRATIDKLFSESFRGGAIARQTEAYNEVFCFKEKLKDALDPQTLQPAPQPVAIPTTEE